MCVFAKSYIESCLANLGWETRYASSSLMVPLTPAVLKYLCTPPGPLDHAGISTMADKYGLPYRTMTGTLMFTIQIGRFDIALAVCILYKFNEYPSEDHFQVDNNVIKYICATSRISIIYSRPIVRERSDLPIGDIIPMRPERGISDKFPTDLPPV
jgi:hypothetical protein